MRSMQEKRKEKSTVMITYINLLKTITQDNELQTEVPSSWTKTDLCTTLGQTCRRSYVWICRMQDKLPKNLEAALQLNSTRLFPLTLVPECTVKAVHGKTDKPRRLRLWWGCSAINKYTASLHSQIPRTVWTKTAWGKHFVQTHTYLYYAMLLMQNYKQLCK